MPSYEDIDIRVSTDGEAELRNLARNLREAGRGQIMAKIKRNMRTAGQPVIADLRMAVMSVQVTSSKGGEAPPSYSRQLRERVAKAIRLSVAYAGVRFNVESNRVDLKYGVTLTKYLDSELPGYANWRHPVFGHEPWVVQHGKPWFFETIRQHQADFEQACVSAVNDVLDGIG